MLASVVREAGAMGSAEMESKMNHQLSSLTNRLLSVPIAFIAGCTSVRSACTESTERTDCLAVLLAGEMHRLTSEDATDIEPKWAPDSRTLAFASDRSGNGDIWVFRLDDATFTRLTVSPGFDHYPTWSPDGKHIAFHSNRSGDFDIWVIPADGGDARQLTSGPGNDMRPAWSPDGTALASNSDRAGAIDIWILGQTRH